MSETQNGLGLMDHPSEHLVQDLASSVEGALWRFGQLRQSNSLIDVSASGGTVRLTGNVRSDSMRSMADRIASTFPGVSRVENELVSDSRIESDISLAIALDEATAAFTDKVRVKSLNGTVYLVGAIARDALADAEAAVARAVELAEATPGVREVLSSLRAVEGTDEDAFATPDEVVEEKAEVVQMAKAMGTLIPDDRKEKIRAMIAAREASRAG